MRIFAKYGSRTLETSTIEELLEKIVEPIPRLNYCSPEELIRNTQSRYGSTDLVSDAELIRRTVRNQGLNPGSTEPSLWEGARLITTDLAAAIFICLQTNILQRGGEGASLIILTDDDSDIHITYDGTTWTVEEQSFTTKTVPPEISSRIKTLADQEAINKIRIDDASKIDELNQIIQKLETALEEANPRKYKDAAWLLQWKAGKLHGVSV